MGSYIVVHAVQKLCVQPVVKELLGMASLFGGEKGEWGEEVEEVREGG